MKYIYILFILLLLSFEPFIVVNASTIKEIEMDIAIDNYGTAIVTENWKVIADQGEELCHPYYNLVNSSFYDLIVWMDGEVFTTLPDWEFGGNLADKAYKSGFYHPSTDEINICFGITDYGEHEYRIQYQILNFVSVLNDADTIFWNLFPSEFNDVTDNVKITIYSDFSYKNNVLVYGYGKHEAISELSNGKIIINSQGRITSNEYLSILIKFPKGTFQSGNMVEKQFDDYYSMIDKTFLKSNKEVSILKGLLLAFVFLFGIIIILKFTVNSKNKKSNSEVF